jgi:hypothetical protein
MNIEGWCAEGTFPPPPQAFICPKGTFLRHSVFLVHYSIFPPKAVSFSSAVSKKTMYYYQSTSCFFCQNLSLPPSEVINFKKEKGYEKIRMPFFSHLFDSSFFQFSIKVQYFIAEPMGAFSNITPLGGHRLCEKITIILPRTIPDTHAG